MLVDGDGSRFVHLALSPLVGVAATVEAEAIAHANNLPTVAHLLGPFGTRVEGKVNILDSQGHAANHEGFSLRFAPLHQLAGPPLAAIKSALIDSVSNSHHPIPLNDAPWYHTYRNYVCKYNGASEHETFNHPVACIVVASTSAPDPIAQLSALAPSSPEKLPAIFGNGYMDTQIAHKYYVLLHDIANENNSVNPDILFTQMKKQFGLSCRLIRVNSKRPNDPEYHESKVWDSFMTEWTPLLDEKIDDLNTSLKTSPSNAGVSRKSLGALTYSEIELNSTVLSVTIENSKSNQDVSTEIAKEKIIYGNLMSENDVKSLEIFVREFVVQSLLPSMERSVQHWNEQVASSRRGFTGRLFTAGRRFLGTAVSQTGQNKSGTTSPGSISPESTIPFPHTSVELILRKLADYSFMLRDYKFAYSQYDSVKKDFSGNERAIKHFAGIQEMLALCVLMTRNDGSSGGGGLRGNVESLLESAIANYLDSGMSIYATRATMLVYECLKSKDGWKEAGGLLLRMVGEREHALRCYLSAQKVYEASGWALIEDHNNFTTGRLQFHLGDPITSYKTFIKLLEESNLGQSTERQAEHLKEFLHVYKSIQKVENLPQTPLPVLLHQTVSVSLVQKLQAGQTSVNDAVWDKMENDLVENGFNKNGKPVKLMKAVRDGGNTICAVGEPVFVSFEVKNPLQIPLLFNDISLFARFDPSQAKPSLGDDHKSSRELKHCYEFFDLENIPKLTLEANETRRIQLTVFPKFEGEIAIDGINLTLSDTIPIFITFAKRGRRLNDTQKQRCSEQPVYAVDNTLKLSVTSPMPVLDIVFHAFPSVLLNGQVERAILEITNKGHRGLKDLKVKLSHPQFFEFGRVEQTDLPIY
ncbi:Trafficking protein particle complex 8, partial [Physocladia obscura]